MTEPDGYTGVDNLEVMADAVNYNQYLEDLVRAGAPQGSVTVDFGAGVGTFAERLAADYDITCVEADEGLQEMLRGKGLKATGDMSDLEPGSLDYVYSLNVLEHIEDDIGVVRQWFTALRPGGAAMVYVPAFQLLYGPMDTKVGHVRRYRRRELATVLNRAGFDIEHLAYADSLGFPASLVMKYTGSKDGSLDTGMVKLYDRRFFPISRALDKAAGRIAGKNLWALARKPY